MTPVYTISCVPWLMLISKNVFAFYRTNDNSLLYESVEKFSTRLRRSSVQPKREFIKIIIQVRCSYRTLMCFLQPTLYKSCHSINQGQQILTDTFGLTFNDMLISNSGQSSIPIPVISSYHTVRFYALLDSRHQTFCRGIRNSTKANTPELVVVYLQPL